MIAYLPLWILGVPLVLGLVDLMIARSGAHELEHDSTPGRYTGVRNELRRDELRRDELRRDELRRGDAPATATSPAPLSGTPTYRDSNAPANIS